MQCIVTVKNESAFGYNIYNMPFNTLMLCIEGSELSDIFVKDDVWLKRDSGDYICIYNSAQDTVDFSIFKRDQLTKMDDVKLIPFSGQVILENFHD